MLRRHSSLKAAFSCYFGSRTTGSSTQYISDISMRASSRFQSNGHLPSYAISRHIQDFVEMGYHIVRYPQPPWIPSISDSWHFPLRGERIRPRTGEAPPAVTPAAYLGAAVTLLIAIESTPAMEGDLQGFNSSRLGLFQELYPYIVHRYVSNSRSLPDLPVPYEFKQVFRDWADNKVNFVGDSPDQ